MHNLYKKQEENNKKEPKERKAESTVYFVVDDQQVADVHNNMANGSKRFMENRDMPVMAVVIDDEQSLGGTTFEVEINGEDHKVQAIGFLAGSENMNYVGVNAVSNIRSNAVQQWNDRDLSGQLERHAVTADIDGSEQAISTILYQVKNKDMDQMLNERSDQRFHKEYKPYARADEEQYKLRTQLEDRYVAVAARSGESTWTEEQIRKGMQDPNSQIYKAAVKELLETEGVLAIEKGKGGEYIQLTIQYDVISLEPGHAVIVTPMAQTENVAGDEWLDILMGEDTNAIINFNYFTQQFHYALAGVLFNGTNKEDSLVGKLRNAKDADERETILEQYRDQKKNWNIGYTKEKILRYALGNWIYLSSNVRYTLEYDEESGDLTIGIESGYFADEEDFTKVNLISFNVDDVAAKLDVDAMFKDDNNEDIDFGRKYTAQFLQNLLLNKNRDGFRQLRDTGKRVKIDEEVGIIKGGGDRTLAHWQLDYHALSHAERGDSPETTYYDGSKYVKDAIVKKLCYMIHDGLLFVNADTITPSTYVPVLANPFSYSEGGYLKLGDIQKKIRDAEQRVRDEREEKERKEKAAKAAHNEAEQAIKMGKSMEEALAEGQSDDPIRTMIFVEVYEAERKRLKRQEELKAKAKKKKEAEEAEKKRKQEEARRRAYTLKAETEILFLDTNSSWEEISKKIKKENGEKFGGEILSAIKECCLARWKQDDRVKDYNDNWKLDEEDDLTWETVEEDFGSWFDFFEQLDPEATTDEGEKSFTDEELQNCRKEREEILKCKKSKMGY